MKWRKIAAVASSRAIVGAGTTVSTPHAFAADTPPPELVTVNFKVFNAGGFVGEGCAFPQPLPDGPPMPSTGDFCTGGITTLRLQSRQFTAYRGTRVLVHGWANGGFDKWREFEVGEDLGFPIGNLEEDKCYWLDGTVRVGFKFIEADEIEGKSCKDL